MMIDIKQYSLLWSCHACNMSCHQVPFLTCVVMCSMKHPCGASAYRDGICYICYDPPYPPLVTLISVNHSFRRHEYVGEYQSRIDSSNKTIAIATLGMFPSSYWHEYQSDILIYDVQLNITMKLDFITVELNNSRARIMTVSLIIWSNHYWIPEIQRTTHIPELKTIAHHLCQWFHADDSFCSQGFKPNPGLKLHVPVMFGICLVAIPYIIPEVTESWLSGWWSECIHPTSKW